MRGARWSIGIVAVLACTLFLAATASAEDSVFWENYESGAISRAALGGGGGTDIIPGPPTAERPNGTAIDAATGKIYWINHQDSRIGYANLDGSDPGFLNTPGVSPSELTGLAIVPDEGRIYWVDAGLNGLFYANLDGSGGGEIPTSGAVFERPYGLAIDPSLGKAFWTNYEGTEIGYAMLDGSGGGGLTVTPTAPDGAAGIAIDAATGKLYWTNYDGSSIGYSNLDGSDSGILDVGTAPMANPEGLAIDPTTGTIYWANDSGNSLGEAPLSGLGGEEFDITGASASEPGFPSLLKKPVARPVPAIVGTVEVGSTLSCPTGDAFEADLVESFLFRAPERETVSWTLNGEALNGATSSTLVATQPGSYTCWITGTNGAGSTAAGVKTILVKGSASTTTPISVSLRPVSKLQVLKLKYDKGHGTATLLAKVSGPGRLYLYGKRVVRDSVRSSGAGIAKVKIAAAGGALTTLRTTGKVKLAIKLKFVTSEGGVAKKSRSVTLHLGR